MQRGDKRLVNQLRVPRKGQVGRCVESQRDNPSNHEGKVMDEISLLSVFRKVKRGSADLSIRIESRLVDLVVAVDCQLIIIIIPRNTYQRESTF